MSRNDRHTSTSLVYRHATGRPTTNPIVIQKHDLSQIFCNHSIADQATQWTRQLSLYSSNSLAKDAVATVSSCAYFPWMTDVVFFLAYVSTEFHTCA